MEKYITKIYFKMKFTCLFDCVYCFCCYFAVIIFFKRFTVDGCDGTCVHIISKRLQTPARRSVDASTLSQKFAHLNNSILKKKSSACRSDAVLRKYYDTLPRSVRFRQLFNDENRNRFYLELGKTDHCYRDCFMATPSLPLEFTGGRAFMPQ